VGEEISGKKRDAARPHMLPPRVVIAAPQGHSGKTTVCLALGKALHLRGLSIQPFKKGPDYIDPSWLAAACGRPCYNLDAFLMGEEVLLGSFSRRAMGTDVALVEGAMGLFDGPGPGTEGSTAALSRTLGAPVILVVNASRMTQSVAAMVGGYQHFDPETMVAGVILNQVAGPRHEQKLRDAIEGHCGLPVLGALPKGGESFVSERHLGLIPARESERAEALIEAIYERTQGHLDLEAILRVARSALQSAVPRPERRPRPRTVRYRLGVFYDKAFNFYYPENLEALRDAGADLVFLDALSDRSLPPVDGLYIGGGFPELYCAELEANAALRGEIAAAIEDGMAVYAECGGMMYLSRAITWKGQRCRMVGAIPAEVELTTRPAGHGYVEAEVTADNPLFPRGLKVRGHEFHHSRLVFSERSQLAYTVRRGLGLGDGSDGFFHKHLFAAYTHLHALATPSWAARFVDLAAQGRGRVKSCGGAPETRDAAGAEGTGP
jgi:cobyrinic acid a,c-diamide synthase